MIGHSTLVDCGTALIGDDDERAALSGGGFVDVRANSGVPLLVSESPLHT